MPKFDWDCFACSQPNTSDTENCISCGKPYIAGKDILAKRIKRKKVKSEHDFYWTVLKNDFLSILAFINRVFNTNTYTGLLNGTLLISAFVAWEYFNNRETLFEHTHIVVLLYVIMLIALCSLLIDKAKGSERRKQLDKYIDLEIAERKREMTNSQGKNETSL